MPSTDYHPPVSQLFTHGTPYTGTRDQWFDYVEAFGFTTDHIPDLIRLTSDQNLDWDDQDTCYAPVHAWRTLGQLQAESAIEPLLKLMVDDRDDLFLEDLPHVFGRIGSAGIPVLTNYIANCEHPDWGQIVAAEGLSKIATYHPNERDRCVQLLSEILANHQQQDQGLNGFLVAGLLHLNATEAIDTIEKAYQEGPMDEWVCGSLAQVKIRLGLAKESDFTPAELEAKAPESIKKLRKTFAAFEKKFELERTLGLSSDAKTMSAMLQELGGASPKSKSGFGTPKSKKKKKKKKR